MTTNIAVVSGTTGVGKTSLVNNLAACCARRGQRVRGIGLDRQMTLSQWNGIHVDSEPGIGLHIGDVLVGRERVPTGELNADGTPAMRLTGLRDAERATSVPGYTIIPESSQLEGDIITLTAEGGIADIMRMELADADPVDINFIDAPGEANIFSVAALQLADVIIVVVSPTGKGTEISNLLARIQRMQQRRQTNGKIVAIIPNIVPSSRKGRVYQDILSSLGQEDYGSLLTKATIREHPTEVDAYLLGSPLIDAFPRGKLTQDYLDLRDELDGLGVTNHGLRLPQ